MYIVYTIWYIDDEYLSFRRFLMTRIFQYIYHQGDKV